MTLSIIVLNWNAAADTIDCVSQINGWERLKPTIWVVDNASTDNSAEIILSSCPQIRLIRNFANLGYAGGNNRGIEQSLAVGAEFIMLLNNDASVGEADTLRLLETLQTNPHIGLIGPCLYHAEKPDQCLSAGGLNPVLHHHSRLPAPPSSAPVYPVMYVPGTVILGRAEVFRQVGLLDEAYFFATEVADFCLQAGRQGFVTAIDTRTRAYHSLGRSSFFRETLYVYYIIRNRFLFIRKHHHWQLWLYAFWAVYSLVLALKLSLTGKPHTAQAVWLGLIDGLQGRFGGQNDRVMAAISHRYRTTKPAQELIADI
jgi:hypothetical protein